MAKNNKLQRVNSIGLDCDYSSVSKPFLSRENSQNIENEIKAENNIMAGKSNHNRTNVDFKRSFSLGANSPSLKLNVNTVPFSRMNSPDTILNIEKCRSSENDLKIRKNGCCGKCWKFVNILSILASLTSIGLFIFFLINKEALILGASDLLPQSSEDDFRHTPGTALPQHHYYLGSNSVQFRMDQIASDKQEKVVWESTNGDGDQFKIDGECVTVPEEGTYIGFATITFKYYKTTEFKDFLTVSVEVRKKLTGQFSTELIMSEPIPPKDLREDSSRRVLKPLQINFTYSLKAGDAVCIRSNREWFLHYRNPLNNFFTLAKL